MLIDKSGSAAFTPLTKLVAGLLWIVLAAMNSAMLNMLLKVYDRQVDEAGVVRVVLAEQARQREDVQSIKSHVVSVDTFSHENVLRLDRRIDQELRRK